jgi:NADPH:quinone reductase-like Zn-dependent oxidoreductase
VQYPNQVLNFHKTTVEVLSFPGNYSNTPFTSTSTLQFANKLGQQRPLLQQASIMTSALPSTIRALLQPDPSSTNLVLTTQSLPTPDFTKDEHLVQIHCCALTNGELLWLKNFPPPPSSTRQNTPGYDISGTIISSPPHSPFPPGSQIYARTSYLLTGSAREYTVTTSPELSLRPKNLSWAEAATVPMSAETAYQALFVHSSGLLLPVAGTGGKGKKVFVTAASGAVGIWVVQLAVWAGAEVIGTASGDNIGYVKALGALEVLDYRTTDLKAWAAEKGKQVDLVIDTIGKASLADAWYVVKDGGVLISVFQDPMDVRPNELREKLVSSKFFVMETNGKQLELVTKGLGEGIFKTRVDSVWPVEKFEEATKRLGSGKTKGKIVLDLGVEGA